MADLINIIGPIEHKWNAREVGGGAVRPKFEKWEGMLDTRNWAWNPIPYSMRKGSFAWGVNGIGPFRVPYSWSTRNKLVSEVKKNAVRAAYTKPNLDSHVVKTFGRLNKLQTKSGKTHEECVETIEQLKTELTQLQAARDQFRARGDAKNERIPRLDSTAKNAILDARMAKEVADAIVAELEAPDVGPDATGDAAKTRLHGAAENVLKRYSEGSDKWVRAHIAVNKITGGPKAYKGKDPLPGAGSYPGIGVHGALVGPADDHQNAVKTANDILKAALNEAKTQHRNLKGITYFTGSPTFDAYARKAVEIERKLKTTIGELFESLCYLDGESYTDVASFRPHWDSVFSEHERIAGVYQTLESFRLSLGLPALYQDKIESGAKYHFREWAKENVFQSGTLLELFGGAVATGVEYILLSGQALPEGSGAVALFALATVINTLVVKGGVFLYTED